MAIRIAGVSIPNDKRVDISITYIFGIGHSRAKKILADLDIKAETKVKDLKEEEANRLRERIEKKHVVEGDLRREISGNIKRLKEIGCYRGLRHSRNLPARGQRTKTNSRTVRGNKRLTMGSGRAKSGLKT
ncbi:30S ribosomal protein S13 [Patescibacteria group bacterium]|nr:30S ribosomal protein S13 [Patescibacteria group bacterium]